MTDRNILLAIEPCSIAETAPWKNIDARREILDVTRVRAQCDGACIAIATGDLSVTTRIVKGNDTRYLRQATPRKRPIDFRLVVPCVNRSRQTILNPRLSAEARCLLQPTPTQAEARLSRLAGTGNHHGDNAVVRDGDTQVPFTEWDEIVFQIERSAGWT